MKKITYSVFGLLFIFFSAPVLAKDNCEQAAYFYKHKQYRSAQTVLEPLLKKGEACAEYYMGLMIHDGNGTKENNENRKKGLTLIKSAEAKGYPAAIKYMDLYD